MAENSGRESGGGCSRCESSPEVPAGPGTLYLWAPLGHTAGKVRRYLKGSGRGYRSAAGGGVALRLEDGSMTRLLSELSGEMLTSRELADTRALFKSGDEEPTADDIPEVRSLKQLATLDRSGWLLDLLSEGRLTSVFQPIVRVEDTSEVFAQECLLRGVDRGGGFIPPQPILDAARDCGMLFQADLAARHTAIHEAADHGIGDNLFVNFSPTSIYDPVFCLRSTVEAVNETGLSPKNVVFEVTETEEVGDPEHLRSIVSYYRNQGFRIALDDLGSGYSSLNLIHRLRPDF
ncbi:MAG: EAL domain-containing protein, partial [Rubrobacter sp.]|nr:EAL domain-containing protein [Rubrobacter sp.]